MLLTDTLGNYGSIPQTFQIMRLQYKRHLQGTVLCMKIWHKLHNCVQKHVFVIPFCYIFLNMPRDQTEVKTCCQNLQVPHPKQINCPKDKKGGEEKRKRKKK